MLEYSRDPLAGPLEEIRKLLTKINDGIFDPDRTRSGRWSEENQETSIPSGDGAPASSSRQDQADENSTRDNKDNFVVTSSSGSSTDDDEEEDLDAVAFEADGLVPCLPADSHEFGYWVQRRYKTIHKAGAGGSTTMCGVVLSAATWEHFVSLDGLVGPRCGRPRCFGC